MIVCGETARIIKDFFDVLTFSDKPRKSGSPVISVELG
jgi:hypothetical protein